MNSIVVDDELTPDVDSDVTTEGEATPTEPSFAMPEKFAGKSAEDIVKSYLEVEKELGRKNNEVGELRKLSDQLLQQELKRTTHSDDPTEDDLSVDFDEFVERPDKVISDIVRKELKSVNKRFEDLSAERRVEKFHQDNPDYQEISSNQEFYTWVAQSPMRQRTMQQAQSGDFDAADAVLAEWRSAQALREEKSKAAEQKRNKQLADASVESAGTGASSDKIFYRSDLMNMYINDPDRYRAMLPDIEKAYAEGRVKNK